jgi:hypothetical protein
MDRNWEISLLALCLWREARNQPREAIQGVACSIRNRVYQPRWWGHSWSSVILAGEQYSSFNRDDPNSTKFPADSDIVFPVCLGIARYVHDDAMPDNTNGAQSYFDKSLDADPPKWAAKMTPTCDIGDFHFYRV